jgi:hypothetical protein
VHSLRVKSKRTPRGWSKIARNSSNREDSVKCGEQGFCIHLKGHFQGKVTVQEAHLACISFLNNLNQDISKAGGRARRREEVRRTERTSLPSQQSGRLPP